jgi:hypothetical protein
MREFIIAVLDDPNGISQEAYDKLVELASYAGDYGTNIDDILARVSGADGRYFLPEDHELQA